MESSVERLEPRLRASALMVLRRYGINEDELRLESSAPGKPAACLITGHRVRIVIDDRSATMRVRAGRWSGKRADFPSAGAFIAAFETALNDAF